MLTLIYTDPGMNIGGRMSFINKSTIDAADPNIAITISGSTWDIASRDVRDIVIQIMPSMIKCAKLNFSF